MDIWKTILKCAQQILTLPKLTHLCTNFVLVFLQTFLFLISSIDMWSGVESTPPPVADRVKGWGIIANHLFHEKCYTVNWLRG